MGAPYTVLETVGFLRDCDGVLTEDERGELVAFIASNPEAGEIMAETGGVRKIRWGVRGRGKSGGVRVIYYFYNETLPIFMLNVFAKNEKANLSKAERNELKRLIPIMVKGYKK